VLEGQGLAFQDQCEHASASSVLCSWSPGGSVALGDAGALGGFAGAGAVGGGGGPGGLLAGEGAPAGVGLALLDDAEEVVVEGGGGVADGVELAAVAAEDFFEVALEGVGEHQAAGPQLDAVGVLEEGLDLAVGLELAVVEDGDAVADVLDVLEAVAAHDDG